MNANNRRNAEAERAFAWAKFYEEEKQNKELVLRMEATIHTMRSLYVAKPCKETEDSLWAVAECFDSLQTHYTEYMDGEKTHKGVKTTQVWDASTKAYVEKKEDYHITAEGTPYKPWRDGDEPSFYMKDYPIRRTDYDGEPMAQPYYKIHTNGNFILIDKYLNKMKGKKGKYVEAVEKKPTLLMSKV